MSLAELGNAIAAAAPPKVPIEYGPWAGSMRSRPQDQVPRDYMAAGSECLYLPRTGTWKRRGGQTIKFDATGLPTPTGLLPAKWGAKVRWAEEFLSASLCSDGVPSQIALFTKETIVSGLDDGRFSNVWVRDQVANAHYTLGSEFNATEYPDAGASAEQRYKVTPLWYDSGDGGLTRGTTEFARRFLVSGSRRFLRVGSDTYFPSVLGTPTRWNGEKATATGPQRNILMPSGPLPPVHAGTLAKGTAADAGEDGPWKGKDRFPWACAYRYADGSIGAFTMARLPNALLPNGLNIFTVDSANPEVSYRSVVFSNLPPLIPGTIALLILRGPKVSYSDGDNLAINPFDMRLVAELRGGVTTYEDTAGDDAAIEPDPGGIADGFFIHPKHKMPPRARFNFGGDMRYGHAYGGENPGAILIAPVGSVADYDRNLGYTDAAAYVNNHFTISVTLGVDALNSFLLLEERNAGATVTTLTYDLSTYDTLQKLVDKINSTSVAVDATQWRAQLAPGVGGEASSFATLCPHVRQMPTCVYANGSAVVTRAGGGLTKIAVGARIWNTASTTFASTAYVLRVDSDTQLTMSEVATGVGGGVTFNFGYDLGDAHGRAITDNGAYSQRVIAPSLMAVLYFTKTYLNTQTPDGTGIDKSSIWLTSASPGSTKSAPNAFVTRLSNKFTPPLRAGISQGGAACDHGFVVPFANQIGVIRFPRDLAGNGLDRDLRLDMLNESRGCCAWNTVVPGNRFVPYLTPEGLVAADLYNEKLLTEDTWVQFPARGDFDYEIPLCLASAAADTDAQYAHARIARGVLRVTYRASGSHPNREVDYDFSSGQDANGLAALVDREGLVAAGLSGVPRVIRRPGSVWGWSLPLVRSVTVLLEARRSDGTHVYGFNDQNAGSTGDGRVDELEVTDLDNGSAIASTATGPWEHGGARGMIRAQEVEIEHSTPAAAATRLEFHRSYADASYTMTPSASNTSTILHDKRKLRFAQRVITRACHLVWKQDSGGASELRSLLLKVIYAPSRSTPTSDTGGV